MSDDSSSTAEVRVLDHDPGLARWLSAEDLRTARRYAVAPTESVERGTYSPTELFDGHGLLGALILEGLVIRQVSVAGRRCGELVGQGGLLRPWDHFGEDAPMPFEVRWRVIEPLHLAMLDRRFLAVAARWPALIIALTERAIERAHTLAFNVAIHCLQHVELRLLVLLWHLADRFGKVTRDGTTVPLPLTHRDLAEIVGSQRPSVSAALANLERRNLVRRAQKREWLLLGDPPRELLDLKDTPRA